MLEHDSRISLAELAAAGLRLRPVDAVTIVREVIAQVIRGEIPGVPSAHVIRLSLTGALTVEGPVVAGGRPVSRGAQLLDTLLPGFDAPPEYRVPGALRLVVARALGTLDMEPHATLESLSEALARFGSADPAAALRELAENYRTATRRPSSPPLPVLASPAPMSAVIGGDGADIDPETVTISDIRRARRATGLSLGEISTRTRIPVSLLRQLEWGYLVNWPAAQLGRTHLVRYARAAGLNEELVVRVATPLIDEAAAALPLAEIELPIEPVGPRELGDPPAASDGGPRRRRRVMRAVGALAIPASIALALLPGVRDEVTRRLPERELLRIAFDGAPPPAPPDAPPSSPPVISQPPSAAPPVVTADAAEPPAAAGPDARPASVTDAVEGTTLVDTPDYFPGALATVGGASFQAADDAAADGRIVPAGAADGGAVLRITRIVNDEASNFHIRPSPDGTRIAFDSNRDGTRGVYVADGDGSNVRRVSGEGFAAVPSWSPDGRRLVYVRADVERPRVWNLWTLDLASGEERQLTSNATGQPWGASWFPDGRRLAYNHGARLVVLDIESGRQRTYPAPGRGELVRTPSVSPDGRRVIFQVERDGAWLLDVGDGSMRKVLSDPTAEDYIWSPDGRRVAYHSRRSGEWGVWQVLSH
jgi:hypothetical protein